MDISRFIPLGYPEMLLVGAVLAWLFFRFVHRRNFWRVAALIIAMLLLAYPVFKRSSRSFDLYVIADRSRSISYEGLGKQNEIINNLAEKREEGDRLAIISFNERAFIEQAPDGSAVITDFQNPYSRDASDLTDAMQTVLSIAGEDSLAKILILSDGEYTGRSPIREAIVASQRGIPIYYRNLTRAEIFNLAVRDMLTPGKILTGEPFRVIARIDSTASTPGRYRIFRDGRIVGAEVENGWRAYNFRAGENQLTFTDIIDTAGDHAYRVEVETVPADAESIIVDNSGERFVRAVGEQPVLLVNRTGQPDNVSRILQAAGLESHIVAIDNYRFDLRGLTAYKGLILADVPLLGMSRQHIDAIRRYVTEEGAGLLVTGGGHSFARGGYYGSPVEEILPVALEDRERTKKISAAFSIVLDRSGSMSMPTPSGQTKIQLANEASAECVRLMTTGDSISVIAVDSTDHTIVPQSPITGDGRIISKIRTIESMGGGIFVYTGLVAAGRQLQKASQINKHILLFADAADSEEPGDYKNLLAKYIDAGVTVSVVGLGRPTDPDADFLRDIAKRGKGEIYFTEDAQQLIQFFTADTLNYTRNNYIEDPAPMAVLATARAIAPDNEWIQTFTSGHYNLLFSRPKATVAIQTTDEDNAPILAFWQRGLGRVAALALDTGQEFADNRSYGDIMISTIRWMMGSEVEDSFLVNVRYEGNYAHIEMEVSREQRERLGRTSLEVFSPDGQDTISKNMHWQGPDRMGAVIKLDEPGAYRGVIRVGDKLLRIDPMSMPVSPEFLPREGESGTETMKEMASLTGGKEAYDLRDVLERNLRTTQARPVILPFLIALLILALLDIAETRFGMLDRLGAFLRRRGIRTPAFIRRVPEAIAARRSKKQKQEIPRVRVTSAERTPLNEIESPRPDEKSNVAPATKEKQEDEEESGLSYLRRSKISARRRMENKPDDKDK